MNMKTILTSSLVTISGILGSANGYADNAGQIDKDLQVSPPVANEQLLVAVQTKIDQLSQVSSNNVTPSGISIPDYKPAYANLQAGVQSGVTAYLTALAHIYQEMQQPLSDLKAIKDQRDHAHQVGNKEQEKLFSDVLESEAARIIPPLNAQINADYRAAVRSMYLLGGNYHIPFVADGTRRCEDSIELYDQIDDFWAQSSYDETQTSFSASTVNSDFTVCLSGSVGFWGGQDDNAKKSAAQVSGQTTFFDCKTSACADELSQDIKVGLEFADQINQSIDLKDTALSFKRMGLLDTNPEISLAMLNAARQLLQAPDLNTQQLVAVFMAKQAVDAAGGVSLELLSAPTAILEKPIRVAASILASTTAKYQLKLDTVKMEALTKVEATLDQDVKFLMPQMVGVQYSN